MPDLQNWLETNLLKLNLAEEMDYEQGFSRLSYTKEEKQSHHVFQSIAQDLGLEVKADQAGNQWATWHVDDQAPTVAVGSHVDTVKNGGGYDGVAGVLTGLAAIKALKDQNIKPVKNISIICFASEESARFGVSTIGSKAISGLLDKEDIASVKDTDGITIKEAIEDFGLSWETIDQAEVPESKLESFLELHIEQGTQIETNDADIGIVRGVACPIRLQVTATGMANHTGTTPMTRRSDAFTAIAPLITFVEEQANLLNSEQDIPLVATVSTVSLEPNVMNVIPGEVTLGIDIRSVADSLKKELADRIQAYCHKIEEKRSVDIHIHTLVDNPSVFLDPKVVEKLTKVTEKINYKPFHMDSGAGHDVMNMANKWSTGLLFIPCEQGISHHPKEFASINDLAKGTQVIAEYLKEETGEDL
ncbi:putative hydrolase [Halobacillus andaensis]|uniref:Hydrolase n=1 Tax=Halobacillus andaensis TaxID=1176239 RepID=A0A917B3B9_HALAA|nr:M20 family metallo-hydrolase [Halobacillus andaensis]MBP2004769.1 N-carbamoyl-L-amino-acid hydrolase [Halobacillus andaensis]GGF19060.1 putative hydrolase [Halobacillus andaensis]